MPVSTGEQRNAYRSHWGDEAGDIIFKYQKKIARAGREKHALRQKIARLEDESRSLKKQLDSK
jgi:hypothetical protein